MNLLITGACGHIGSYVVQNLPKIKKIKKTVLIDNLEFGRHNSLFNNKKKNKIRFYLSDLKDKKSLNEIGKIDYVIHLASMTNAENSFKDKKKMYDNNLGCFKNVLNYCIKNKCKLIHISSTSVYGKQTNIVDEDCEKKFLKPQSPYADIKLIEENILNKNKKKIKFVILRFGTIAGISPGMRFHTAVNKFCFLASIKKPITVYKTAMNQFRPYLSLQDAFMAFKFCIDKNLFNNEKYNILSGNFTVKHILDKIKKYKKNIKINYISSPIMNQLSYHVSNAKICEKGLKLKNSIDSDVKDTIKLLDNI